jgi:hypothetical protein
MPFKPRLTSAPRLKTLNARHLDLQQAGQVRAGFVDGTSNTLMHGLVRRAGRLRRR